MLTNPIPNYISTFEISHSSLSEIILNKLLYYDCVQVAAHSNVTFEIITLEEVGRRSMETMTMDDDEMGTAYSTMNSSGRSPRLLCVS